jgi:hypothetical protein
MLGVSVLVGVEVNVGVAVNVADGVSVGNSWVSLTAAVLTVCGRGVLVSNCAEAGLAPPCGMSTPTANAASAPASPRCTRTFKASLRHLRPANRAYYT